MARDLRKGWGGTTTTKLNLTQKGYPSAASTYVPQNTNTTKLNTSFSNASGGSGGSGGGSGKGSSYDALLEAYKKMGLLGNKNALAQQAYDKSMAALNAAYGEYMGALASNLDTTKATLQDSYNRSKKSIMDDSSNSLKQAYVNKMLSEKNLDQQMAAQGLSGGATETTRASMSNNYGNARNEINRTTNNNLSQLEGNYNENLAAALSAYNQAVAQAQLAKAQQAMEIENALANNQMAALDDFMSLMGDNTDQYLMALSGAMDNSKGFTWESPEVVNAIKALELIQPGNGMDERSYNNFLAALQEIMKQGGKNPYAMALLSQIGA